MISKIKFALAGLGALALPAFASAQSMETAINNAVSSTTDSVVDVLTTNIPVVMVVFGGLVALGIVLHLIGRLIGRRA